MTKKFITIVPHIENIELRKDTGQIPFHFYKVLGYESTIVTYFYTLTGGRNDGPVPIPPSDINIINANYPFLKSEVPGLKIHFLPQLGRGKFYEKAILKYLKSNAGKIDILNLFHFTSENIFYTFYYKWKNPKGKVFLKLDIDIGFYKTVKDFIHFGKNFPLIGKQIANLIIRLFFNKVTVISAESVAGLKYFMERFNPPKEKLVLAPNGVDSDRILKLIPKINTFEEKENAILFVGRIGNSQKNTSFLLSAIAKINFQDWKLYLVGPIEPEYEFLIADFFEKNSHLKGKVIFTGALQNPTELYSFYNKSKIFCLPSLHEGFPLVVSEALFFDCYLLLSDQIYAAPDFCFNGVAGELFSIDDTAYLCYILTSIIDGTKDISRQAKQPSTDRFVWKKIIEVLSKKL